MLRNSIILLVFLLIAGCSPKKTPPAAAKKLSYDFGSVFGQRSPTLLAQQSGSVIQLDIYQLLLPRGAVSRNEEFWKRIDEARIDVATYDLLLKNGIRAGIAPTSDWGYFKEILDRYPTLSHESSISGAGPGSVEMSMKKGIGFQDIFYLSDRNILLGRSYERCENLFAISFQRAPRQPQNIRLMVCPLVRGMRKRFEVSVLNEEREIDYVSPERLYQLNLRADVSADGFLVIAPSELAQWPTSLGSAFLLKEGDAEQFEQVLFVLPRNLRGTWK